MDHKTFLFFDTECANMFDGIGKICSIGYVLTDDEFNVIEQDDIIINPEADFDWYLFSKKNESKLAYSKDYFRSKPNFESYYKRVKKLFTNGNTYVLGFAVENDISFINSACVRYYKEIINYRGFDVMHLAEKVFGTRKKLFEWAQFLNCNIKELQAHKSLDDAIATMQVFKEICNKENLPPEELLKKYKGFFTSSENIFEQQELRQYKKEMNEKIKKYFSKRCPNPIRKNYLGQKFILNKEVYNDLERALNITKRIYDAGGMIFDRLKLKSNDTANIVYLTETVEQMSDEQKSSIEKRNFKIILAEEIERIEK